MRHRPDPWKWPCSIGLAFALLFVGVLFTPASWFAALLSIRQLEDRPPTVAQRWLELLAVEPVEPIVWEVQTDENSSDADAASLPSDAQWWRDSWRLQARRATEDFLIPERPDSLPGFLLDLNTARDDLLARATPDSTLAARLALLRSAERVFIGLQRLKPLLWAERYSRAMADIRSRAADMFDEPSLGEIIVTEPPPD